MLSVLILGLAFHTEEPGGVINAVNIFNFPDLSLAADTESVLVARRWDKALDSNTLPSYTDTSALMTKQIIFPIVGWEVVSKMIDKWIVLLNSILGPPELHPAVHELRVLVEAAKEVRAFLRS